MPLVSVIIPTYEKHHKYLPDAIRSVDFPQAEIIVVNDSLTHLEDIPNVTVINREDEASWGTGKARNIGADNAEGEALVWLDSDDMFIPKGIQLLWEAYVKTKTPENPGGNIVYGDLVRSDTNYYWRVKDQYCGDDLVKSGLITSNRPYCCLISKINHYEVGGYDEELPTYEDIDYEKKTTVAGMCETHLNAAIYWYRWDSGERRLLGKDDEIGKAVNTYMYNKYKDYHTGVKKLGNCRKCGDQAISPYRNTNNTKQTLQALPQPEKDEVQYLVYTGGDPTHTKVGDVTNTAYRFGADRRHSRKRIVPHLNVGPNEVNRDDAIEFLKMRIHNRDQFKFQTEIIVDDTRREPTPTKTKTRQPVPNTPAPEMSIVFDEDSITNYTIQQMKDRLAEEEVPRSQLQLWLEEELGQGKDKRITMEKLLRDAIG